MSEQPKYGVILKLPDGKKYEFEQISSLQWERYENLPGQCKFSLPQNDPKISLIANDSQFIQILIVRDGSLVWQGFVAYIRDEKDVVTIWGLGLLECLKWYRVGYDTEYSGKKIGSEIISPIWDLIDARTGAILGDVIKKGTIQDPYDTGTTTAKTIDRTVFDEDFYTLCMEMLYLSRADSPSGAWVQNAVMAVSLSETAPTFSFSRNVGEDKSRVIWELDSEIAAFRQDKDFRFIRNDVKGLGIAEGPEVLNKTETDSTSRTSYYLREISKVFERVTSQSELDEATKNYLAEEKDPRKTFGVNFSQGIAPFDGYVMGDNVKIRISRGRLSVDEYFRVVGMEVAVTDAGVELVNPVVQRKRT
jgi:hypothetical protein